MDAVRCDGRIAKGFWVSVGQSTLGEGKLGGGERSDELCWVVGGGGALVEAGCAR